MDYDSVINKYYAEEGALKSILLQHSESVARKVLQIADTHPELNLDHQFLLEAAMLHDIGIFACEAPGIYCFGTEPYIRHGIIGGEILRKEGLPRHAQVCERHTGTGLTATYIKEHQLPLPDNLDFCPETLEEKAICYADKFFSKSHLEKERTLEEAYQSLLKFGTETAERLIMWSKLFE